MFDGHDRMEEEPPFGSLDLTRVQPCASPHSRCICDSIVTGVAPHAVHTVTQYVWFSSVSNFLSSVQLLVAMH
jgi:hypothetical protein